MTKAGAATQRKKSRRQEEEEVDEDEEDADDAREEPPPPRHAEAWKNAIELKLWERGRTFEPDRESTGSAWQVDMKEARARAKAIYQRQEFIDDNWPLVSDEDYQARRARWDELLQGRLAHDLVDDAEVKALADCVSFKEARFFDMQDDPQRAADNPTPFYILRPLPSLVDMHPTTKQQVRLRCSLRDSDDKSVAVSTTSLLYRVAYPDVEFTAGHHLSHLVSTFGELSLYCVAPRFLVLESAREHTLRLGCGPRFRWHLKNLKDEFIAQKVEITWPQLFVAAGLMAKKLACSAHNAPLCKFEVDRPEHAALRATLKATLKAIKEKPGAQAQERDPSREGGEEGRGVERRL